MKALLDEKTLKSFNTKTLFRKVINLFDDYNMKQFMINNITVSCQNLEYHPEKRKNSFYDPTEKATIERDYYIRYIHNFETKLNFIKSQFTEDELIIFKYSLEERESDKVIIAKINKSDHRYYQIKKSCYLKIALAFGIATPESSIVYTQITQTN